MMDYDELMKRLVRFDGRKCVSSDAEVEAADAIDTLRRERDEAREALAKTRRAANFAWACLDKDRSPGALQDAATALNDALAAIDAALKEDGE